MKVKSTMLPMIIALFLLGGLWGCVKEEEDVSEQTSSYFTVKDGTYKEEEMPASSGSSEEKPSITAVQGNSFVVPGGASYITVKGSDPQNDITQLLIGVKGGTGYYVINTSGDSISIQLTLSENLPRDTFIIIMELRDRQDNVSESAQLEVKKAQVSTGKLEIALSWDQYNDIDLHVVQPDSEEIYYSHKQSSEGGYLDLDSNPGCNIDSINNEHVYYPDTATILAGEYIVRVDFYKDCTRQGITHYTVIARYNGELIRPISGSNPYEGTFEAGTDDGGSLGAGVEVMRFRINGTKTMIHFKYPVFNQNTLSQKKPTTNCKR